METTGATETAPVQEPVQRKELRPRCYQLELFEEAKRRNVRWRACLSVAQLSIRIICMTIIYESLLLQP